MNWCWFFLNNWIIWIFNYSSSIYWEWYYFSTKLLSPLCQKSVASLCMDLSLEFLFSSTDLFVCLDAISTLFCFASYSNRTYYAISPFIFFVSFSQPLKCKLHKGWHFCHFCSLQFPRILFCVPECCLLQCGHLIHVVK